MRETYSAKPNGIISHLLFIKFAISHGGSKPPPYDLVNLYLSKFMG
jgi:hypothetical protein